MISKRGQLVLEPYLLLAQRISLEVGEYHPSLFLFARLVGAAADRIWFRRTGSSSARAFSAVDRKVARQHPASYFSGSRTK